MAEKLKPQEQKQALETLTFWVESNDGNAITKTFKFETFLEALEFMNQVSLFIEEQNHHPTWTNTYNQVIVLLSTHDAGGVSAKDIALAHHMEKIAYTLLNRGKLDPSDQIF
jgi:4a-hydroxytetrahydrobiopterin dehydratase